MSKQSLVPLGLVDEGKNVRLSSFQYGFKLEKRLTEMGIREGKILKIIRNSFGPIIVMIDQSRYALGRGISMKILAEVVD